MPDYSLAALAKPLPCDNTGELEALLFRQDGVISRVQALRFMSAQTLSRRVASGRWRAAHRGVYVAHSGPVTDHQRLWIAVLGVGGTRPALLAGLSALLVLGLRRFTSRAVHVLLPARHRDRDPPPGVIVHRTRTLPPDDRRERAGPPCTRAPRSVVDAAQWARSDDEARTIIAATFQQRLVGGEEIQGVLARMPQVRRRALIMQTVEDARDGSETVTELDLVGLCRASGLPIPSRQMFRKDSSGRTRYLDACFDEWGVRIEVDGAHHMFVEEWWQDMDRHNDLATPGEMLLRFAGWKIRYRPDEVAARIRKALRDAGWEPSAAE